MDTRNIVIGCAVTCFLLFDTGVARANWLSDRFCWRNCLAIKKMQERIGALEDKQKETAQDVLALQKRENEKKETFEKLASDVNMFGRDLDGLRNDFVAFREKTEKKPAAVAADGNKQTSERKKAAHFVLAGGDAANFEKIRRWVGGASDAKKPQGKISAIRYYTKNREAAWPMITEHAIRIQRSGIRLPDDWRPEPMEPDKDYKEGTLAVAIRIFSEDGS